MNNKRLGILIGLIAVIVVAQLLLKRLLVGNEAAQTAVNETVENVIVPLYKDFAAATKGFVVATDGLCQQLDQAHLEIAQKSWRETRIPWKQAEAFLIGPVISDRLRSTIEYRYVRLNEIEKTLARPEPLTAEQFARKSAPEKGFYAAEFILFELIPKKPEIYFNKKSCAYLSFIAQEISKASDNLVARWTGGTEPYSKVLMNPGPKSREYATAQQSLDTLVNHAAYLASELSTKKIGRPLGEGSNFPQPDEADSRFSHNSWADLKNNLIGLEKILFAGQLQTDEHGMAGLAKNKRPALVAKIKQQLAGLHQQIDGFDKPLDEAVLYEKERVKKVYDEAVALNQSISVDLINTLGVTATFSENDGD